MAEYISKEQLLFWIEHKDMLRHCSVDTTVFAEQLKRYIREIPAADVAPAQKWISTKDRLPELVGECRALVIVSGQPEKSVVLDHAYMLAEYYNDGVTDYGWIIEEYPEWEKPDVHYWMPLPEQPRDTQAKAGLEEWD